MAFPITQVPTTNLDAGTDSPSAARSDLLLTVQTLNTIVAEANTANGVVVLNESAQIPGEQVPSVLAPTVGILTLTPESKTVKIEDVLRLQLMPVSVLLALPSAAEGDVVYTPNGDAGEGCLAVYDGDNWRTVVLGAVISDT